MPEETKTETQNPTPTPPEFVPHWQGKPKNPEGAQYVECHGGWKLVPANSPAK
jgi:hypothetical protein